jgi:TldD protein
VRQVTASLASSWQHVEILRGDRHMARYPPAGADQCVGGGRRRRSAGKRVAWRRRPSFGEFLTEDRWQFVAGEALRQALVNLEAVPAPAGTSTSCCRPAGRA